MKELTRILIVEDKSADADLAKHTIHKVVKDCEFQVVETRQDFLNALETFQPHVILSDYSLPRFDGMKALKLALEHAPLTPFIIWTGSVSEDVAVECIKAGANNYILKDNIKRLGPALIHALEERQLLLERKQAEDALQNSEKRFRALIENGLDNISLLKADGTLIWESPAAVHMLEYAPDEFVGRDIFALMHPDDLDWTRDLYAKLIQEPGGHERGTFRLRRSDGTWRWVDAIVTNMLNEPSVNAMVVNYRDVTEHNQAKVELQHKNDDLGLINALNEVINRGEGVDAVLNLMAKELKRIFSSNGTTIYLLNPDRQSLKMQQHFLSPETTRKIERVIGRNIPLMDIPIQEGGFFQAILSSGHGSIISDPKVIQKWMEEFVESPALPAITRGAIRKLIPQIYKLLKIKSTIIIPLISDGKAIGLLDVSSPSIFTTEDLHRIENIGGQLTTAIRRRQMEEELRDERNLLRTLIDNVPDRMYAMDLQGRKTLSNTADWKASGGESMEDVIGKTDFDMYPPELAGPFWQLDRAVLDSGQSVINFEEPGLDFEGNRVSILTTKIPLRDGEGKVIGLVGIGRDITERKRVEAKLQSSESRYRLATQATKDVIWEWNREDNQLIWTENAQLVFGYSPEEIPAASWWDEHIHPEDRERVTSKLNTLTTTVGGESVWSDEYRFQLKNGSYAYIADHAYIERDPAGATIRMIGAMANITERKRAEEALRESEEHYRAIFEGVQDAIFVESRDGKILMVNDRACEMFGYSHAEFLTKTVADLVPRNHQILTADNLDSSLSAEPHETVNQRANGEVFPIEISGRLQVINGETVLLVVIRDITGQKRAEEALRESERRYRALFEDTPIAIWEEDFSEVKKHLDSLKQQGITDFREYFATHPEAVITCADMIRVLGVNNATLQMYHASSKDDLLEKINQGLSKSELKYLQEAFIGITERRTSYRWEGTDETITGEAVKINVSASVTPGHESDYSRVIVTIATTDITEQKRAEEALHQSEALYRQAIEVAGAVPYYESYYDEGRSIKYEFIGEGIRQITGYGPEEFSSALWDSLVEEVNLVEDLAGYSLDEGILRVRAGENSIWKCEHRLRDRDGKTHWVFEAAVELRDENGVSHGSIGTYQDITAHKQAEQSLRAEREKAQNYLDIAGVMMLAVDQSGTVTLINQKGCEILGYSADEIIGRNWIKTFLPESAREELQGVFQQLFSGDFEPVAYYENSVLTKGEEGRLIAWHNTVVRDGQGTIISTLSSGQDITERKRAERALQESEEKYRKLAEQIPAAVYVDLADDSGKTLYISSGVERILGYSSQDWLEKPDLCSSIIYPEDFERVSNETATAEAKGQFSLDYRFVTKDGRIVWVRDEAVLLGGEDGQPKFWQGLIMDITERKRTEDAEHEQRALAEALRDTAESLSSTLDYGEVLDQILAAVGRVVPHDAATIMLIDGGSARVVRSHGYDKRGFNFEVMGVELPLAETTNLRQMLETGQTEVVYDTHSYQGWKRLSATDWLRSSVGAPISIYGEVIGFILLDSQTPGFFTPVHAKRLEAFANQAAIAIHNAHLLQQAQDEIAERKRAEEALRESERRYRALFEATPIAIWEEDFSEVKKHLDSLKQQGITDFRAYFASHPEAVILCNAMIRVLDVNNAALQIYRAEHKEELIRSTIQAPSQGELEHNHEDFMAILEGKTSNSWEGSDETLTGEGIEVAVSWSVVPGYEEDLSKIILTTIDITKRKHAEEELRASEERFRQLADNIQEVFWMTDAESGEELYISPAAETIWERPIERLRNEPDEFINSIFAADQPAVLGAIEREKNGEKMEIEYRIVQPNGSVRWVWDRAFPIFDESGRVKRIAGITADITERRESEIALVKSQNRYRELFDSSPISIWEEDYSLVKKQIDLLLDSGVINLRDYLSSHPDEVARLASLVMVTDVNKASLELYHVEHKEYLLKNLTQILSKESISRFQEEILGLMSPLKRFVWEGTDKVSDGRQLEVIVNGSIPTGYEEDWSKVIVSIIDISERRQAEQQLRKLSRAVEQSASTIVITDTAGNIEYINPKFTEITGYTYEEAIGQNPRILKSGFTSDETYKQLWETITSGEDWYGELLNRKKNGELFWENVMLSPILNEHGEITHFVGVKEDITERKRAAEEIRRRADEFAALYETARDLATQYNLPTLLNTMVERARALLHSPGGGVYLYDRARGDLEMVLAVGSSVPVGARLKMGEGMAGRVAQTRQLLIVDDYQTWAGHSLQYESIPFRAVLQAPMLYGGELIGVLSVYEWGESERKYTDADAHLLLLFAEYAASAIHAARLLEESHRRTEETSALLQTSLALTNLELEATLQTIGNSAKTLFEADGCRIFLMEPDGQSLRCVLALQENFAVFSNLRIKVGEGVTGAVAASGQAEIVNEMQNDPRSVQVSGTEENEPEAIMFAPLKERDHTIGVLSVRRAGAERPFQSADLKLLEAFASMTASAVSNARLFEETQDRLAQLEALYENGLSVGRLLKPSEIGKRIIETFANHLSWHHVTIRLKQPDSDELKLIAFNQSGLSDMEKAEVENRFSLIIAKVGQGLSGWVVQTGLSFRTGNVTVHPQYVNIHSAIRSGLYMPLKVGEHVTGVISVESEVPDAFTEQDERLLATLANQAAIAFENARLYQAIEQELVERKRAEKALRSSEVHYRELADSIADILFELDQDFRYTHWNKASEMFSGIPAEDVIGKPMQEVFGTAEEQSRREEIYKSVLKERQARTFETEVFAKGQKRALEINAYPSARGVSVVAKDVTERKWSEIIMQKRFELMEFSAHHSLAELMQKTIDEVSELTGSSIGFLHFVNEDQLTLRMQTWSTSVLQLFHVPVSEGAHLPLDQAGVWAEAARQRRPLIQNDYESLSKRKGLPQGHMSITRELVIPIIRNERIMAVMGIANKPQDYTQYDLEIAVRLADYAWDITERKQMELALEAERNQLAQRVNERTADLSRANSNLARALRVKDEFLANMSHELRTPLNAILGLSESLSEQIAGPLNEKQQKYIGTISESGHHLLSLINDILDLAKIDAGQITLDINKVDIHSVCQASLRMIKQLAQKKNQDVSLTIDDGLGLMWADERRLKQMLVNLLGNAVKFTPENGKLGLEVHGDEDANKISFTIWDRGIGIREGDLARLFQPFVQLDSGLARESTGTGLGLALVAQMARLHGGSISAISEPENGSRFTVTLPWEPALAMDAATRMKITGKFRAIKLDEKNQPTILLVEDTKEVTMMIKDYLELAGYRVVTAQDGLDAIVQAKLVRPDLILMDVQMPRMDGLEATRRLRSEPDFRYTPIIAVTALAMAGDRERCLEAGMDEYISKPVNLKALIKIIQGCLFSDQGVKSQ